MKYNLDIFLTRFVRFILVDLCLWAKSLRTSSNKQSSRLVHSQTVIQTLQAKTQSPHLPICYAKRTWPTVTSLSQKNRSDLLVFSTSAFESWGHHFKTHWDLAALFVGNQEYYEIMGPVVLMIQFHKVVNERLEFIEKNGLKSGFEKM